MTKYIFNIILLSMILSSCSNFLTWHLDKGIHKNTSQKSNSTVESDNIKENYNVSSSEVWSTSTNSGIHGNTGYLKTHKKNDLIYSVDSYGLVSAVSSASGDIVWQIATNYDVSSGISVVSDKVCFGTTDAKLICFDIETLSLNSHYPLITSMKNLTTFSKSSPDIEIELLTELASPILSINNLFLLKLDNDDLYLIDPTSQDVIWKSESQNIPLRTKGASMPLIQNNTVYIARDNGSLSAYDQTNGTLKWLTIISSRSGRNDLESQRDAEMNILVNNNRLFYGHFQGDITSLDLNTGDIVWSSPLSFINNISIHGSSILGSTTSNVLVSLDKASGFTNWKNELNKDITEPFIIDRIVMIFSTDGTLFGYDIDSGDRVYEEEYGYDIHPKTEFIVEKNNVYFQTSDGETIHLRVNL